MWLVFEYKLQHIIIKNNEQILLLGWFPAQTSKRLLKIENDDLVRYNAPVL